jgi:coenzyme F420-0:L-glutamate ligase/coenzyme F420-1:gamma-L-glutamate ligase
MVSLAVHPVRHLPAIQPNDPLPRLLHDALGASGLHLEVGDVIAVCQKVVSKSEGRVANLEEVVPSDRAWSFAEEHGRDPRVIEIVLRESRRIVRMERGLILSETATGLVCANAGVDRSNAHKPGHVTLLPSDPDASAERIRRELGALVGVPIGVVVTDTFGRPWREGLVDVAIGVAGLSSLRDLRGTLDLAGRPLEVTVLALADQVAAAAGLVMGKGEGIPAVIVRGVGEWLGEGRASDLVRPPERDLFR